MGNRNANSLNRPHSISVVSQTWIWKALRRYCESNWESYCEEEKIDPPRQVSRSTPETVAAWCSRIRKRNGRNWPAIVGAAAAFRSDFVRLIAVALPDIGVELPGYPDLVEKAIADSPDWASAVQVALDDVERVKEVLRHTRPRWKITANTNPKVILDRVQKEYKCRLSNLFKRSKAGLSIFHIEPLAEPGYIVVPVSPENESIVEVFASPSEQMKEATIDVLVSQTIDQKLHRARASRKGKDASDKTQLTRVIGFSLVRKIGMILMI